MSEKKKDEAAEAPAAAAKPDEGASLGRPADDAEELKLQHDLLAEENRYLRERLVALEGIGAKAKEADSTGTKRPFSLVQMFGVGRREIKAGDPLNEAETKGLKEGSDFELR